MTRLDAVARRRRQEILRERRRAAQRARILNHLRAAMIHSRGRWL